MNHPKKLRVLGRDVKVRFRPAGHLRKEHGAVGLYHWGEGLIEVDLSQDRLDLADTLVHELFHAILHLLGPHMSTKTEEKYVESLATGLVNVLKDNPQLIKWLASHIHEPPNHD